MLVLSRKVGEEIIIGEQKIRIAAINGKKVRLAIDAPKWVSVYREEIRDKRAGRPTNATNDEELAQQ